VSPACITKPARSIEGSERGVDVETSPALVRALDYAKRGWKVFRCAPGTKKPTAESHGFKDATSDAMTIERWWSDRIVWNVAIATGQPSGFFVVDADLHKPGCEFSQLDPLPKTYTVHTPSGGQHLYFRQPHRLAIKSGNDKLGRFVDVKSDGGYVLAPPSVFEGGQYRITNAVTLASAPEWLLSRLCSASEADITARSRAKEPVNNDLSDSVHSVTLPASLLEAVKRAIPQHLHQNNGSLFLLSRSLLTLERSLGRKLTFSENMEAFDLWHQEVSASGLLRPGQPKEQYMSEFANARRCARVALGDDPTTQAWLRAQSQPLPPEAGVWESQERKLLVALCYQIDLTANGQRWFLSCRDAARLVLPSDPKGFVKANRWLNEFVGLGILEIVERGTAIRATRYRFIPATPKTTTIT
jgi:hypothetical protein